LSCCRPSTAANAIVITLSSSSKNLISQIFLQIYSLADYRYQRQFSLFILSLLIKTAANTIVLSKSFSHHLSLATVYLSISLPTIYLTLASTLSEFVTITPKKGISTLDVFLLDNAVPLCRQVTSGSCSTRLLLKNLSNLSTKGDTTNIHLWL